MKIKTSEAATGRTEAVMIRVRIPDTRDDNRVTRRELLIVTTATGKIAMRVVTLTRQQTEHDSVSWMSASEDEAAAILSHAVREGWLIEPAWIKRALS